MRQFLRVMRAREQTAYSSQTYPILSHPQELLFVFPLCGFLFHVMYEVLVAVCRGKPDIVFPRTITFFFSIVCAFIFVLFLCIKLGLQSWERFAINWQNSLYIFFGQCITFLFLLFTSIIYWAWFLWISVFEIGSRDSSHLKLIFFLCVPTPLFILEDSWLLPSLPTSAAHSSTI